MYNITGSLVVLHIFAWQKCMLDDGRLLELSEPSVWALVWVRAQHIPVWNRSHISERNPVLAFSSSTVCWSSLARVVRSRITLCRHRSNVLPGCLIAQGVVEAVWKSLAAALVRLNDVSQAPHLNLLLHCDNELGGSLRSRYREYYPQQPGIVCT